MGEAFHEQEPAELQEVDSVGEAIALLQSAPVGFAFWLNLPLEYGSNRSVKEMLEQHIAGGAIDVFSTINKNNQGGMLNHLITVVRARSSPSSP